MRTLILVSTLMLCCTSAVAGESRDTVVRQGVLSEDTYLAGERVEVSAEVQGDLIVAAGIVTVAGHVTGDVMAAGGEIKVSAALEDDLRAAGGRISVCGSITGDAVLAGGEIDLCADTLIGNRAWIVGGDVSLKGRIKGDATLKAGKIVLGGEISGNVDLEAGEIEILPGAVIAGDLHYKSPAPARIHDGAQIIGETRYTAGEPWWSQHKREWDKNRLFAFGLSFMLVFWFGVVLTALVLSRLLPATVAATRALIKKQFLQCIAIGIVTLVVTPMAIILLTISIVGLPLAFILSLVYILVIIGGFYTSLLYVANQLHQWLGATRSQSNLWANISLLLATLALLLLNVVPLVGGLIQFFVYLTGIGAISMHLHHRRFYAE